MKVTEHNTIAISGAVHPHGHTSKDVGPFSLRVGIKSQPDVLREWATSKVLLCIEQPNDRDNFTIIRVLYLRGGVKKPSFVSGCVFHRVKQYRRPGEEIEVRIRKRYCDSLLHPLPTNRYTGTCMYDVDGGFVVLTLQAVSLRKGPEPQEPKTILTSGDKEYGVTLRDIKRAVPRIDGMGGRGVDASGLRHG